MSQLLTVDVESTCIISGYCRRTAPDVFVPGPDRKTVVTGNPVPGSDAVRDAMENCPVEAITAIDTETGEQVFP